MSAPLLFGPYKAPALRPGDWLMDEVDGLVPVGRWSNGPIPWPCRRKTGRASLILTGALVEAVRRESVEAICAHWGVGPGTAWKWRRALGVDRVTEGTRVLLRERTGVPVEAASRGREAAAQPEARARMVASKTGVPAPPKTRAALLEAARASKPAGWGKRANAWMRAAKPGGSSQAS